MDRPTEPVTPEASPARPIRASTILPARRTDIELETADGLTLVGELALPPDRDPVATLVTLHPLPPEGGYMDSHIFRKAAWRLPALADLAVLRFNLRGVTSPRGTSGGAFDQGIGERYDVIAAIEYVEFHDLPRPWVVGWSFGTELALKYACDPAVEGVILLSAPLKRAVDSDLEIWAESGKPVVVLVPEFDDYLRPPEAIRRFATIPQAEIVAVEGAKHLWVGSTASNRVLDEIVRHVAPERTPLPTVWTGTSQTSAISEESR